jgi:esterase/lipase superfamily enzyme
MQRIFIFAFFTLIAACAPSEAPHDADQPVVYLDETAEPPIATVAGPPPAATPAPETVVVAPAPVIAGESTPDDIVIFEDSAIEAAPLEEMVMEEMVMEDRAETASPAVVEEDFFTIRVSFATNRAPSTNPDAAPAEMFTSNAGPLSWGQADVTIPAVHERGVLETPNWLSRRLFGMNPARHVVLQDVMRGSEESVLSALRAELADAGSDAILVYVHGYATDFEKAARRMAQMKHDLQFAGPALFFSWPSRGPPAAYPQDSNMVRVTQPHMEEVLRKLAEQPASRIVMIAHSMGTQVLSYALADLIEEEPALADRFNSVILAAPDIDERVFTEQLVPAFEALPEPVTLYASSNDAALKASRRFNGYARIGDASEVLRPFKNVVVIDASNVVSDFFGHRYFAENTSILHDIYQKVVKGLTVTDRSGLSAISMGDDTIYRITGN